MANGHYSHICKNGHPLSYSTSAAGYLSGTFTCDCCHNSHSCGLGRYNCRHCKFDVCNQCAASFKTSPTPIHNCRKGHSLTFTKDQTDYPDNTFVCDSCHRGGACSLGRWNCALCKYDICSLCRLPPMPAHHLPVTVPSSCQNPSVHVRIHCPKGHFLYESTHSAGYICGKFSCDQCHEGGYCSAGRFCCQACKYDLCKACKPY